MKKVVLITGGSSGLGKSIGIYLQQRGYVVYGTSRNAMAVTDSEFPLVSMDLNQEKQIQEAVNEVITKEGRLDVLVNNAGMGITGPIEETPTDEMRRVFETNVFGAITVMKSCLPQMRAQRSGIIINVTSIAGYMGLPYRGVYSATKGALGLITEAIRMEVKEFGISVCTVAPGDFATNIASGRYHTPVIKGSPYEEKYQMNLDLMNTHVDSGSDPVLMAKAVHKIIENPSPRIHYKVGEFMQKFSVFLKKILPEKVYEKLLMNHYKL